ncbi:MAG: CbrC family protein [Lachnospiraceae bacterium]|nr:CbrC family protein [Lachnospiraceae bacterium]
MELRPEEIEPLRIYNILANDDDELLIQLPGYFKGEALEHKLLYNGGSDAILVRNKYQKIICDCVHPEVRPLLKKAEKVLIFETDMMREYFAEVVKEDIDQVCEEAVKIHDDGFPCHPFPVIDGTLDTGLEECSFCHKKVKVFYRTRSKDKDYKVCRNCIKSGTAYNNGLDLNPELDSNCRAMDPFGQIFQKTPPIIDRGKPAKLWGAHCNELGVYLGMLEPEDIDEILEDELIETWDNEFNNYKDLDAESAFAKLKLEDCTCHMFRCIKCQKKFCIFFD